MQIAISTTNIKRKVISWFFVNVFGLLGLVLFYLSLVWSYYLVHERAMRPLSLSHAAC